MHFMPAIMVGVVSGYFKPT